MKLGKWVYKNVLPAISTFSIVAFDETTQEIGIAVQSKFLCVGAFVPWATADAGGIATQSFCNTSFGPRGLDLMRSGTSPEEVLKLLLADDPDRELRQVGIVDTKGRTATFTGVKNALIGQVVLPNPASLVKETSSAGLVWSSPWRILSRQPQRRCRSGSSPRSQGGRPRAETEEECSQPHSMSQSQMAATTALAIDTLTSE